MTKDLNEKEITIDKMKVENDKFKASCFKIHVRISSQKSCNICAPEWVYFCPTHQKVQGVSFCCTDFAFLEANS